MIRIILALLLVASAASARSIITNGNQSTLPPAFYVAPGGSDLAAGTLAAPFATITKAQTAMRGGSVKLTFIRAGNYAPAAISCSGGSDNCAINLTSSDVGETFSYYPPDGYNSASFTGGSTAQGNGLFILFHGSGSTNVTINGLTLHNFQYAGVSENGGTGMVVENNIIFNGFYVPGSASSPGGFTCYSCSGTTLSHNAVHDIAGFGLNITEAGGVISNDTITGNVLYNICTGLQDCGALYLQDLNMTSTNLSVTNNYVRDGNTNAGQSSSLGEALYLDDCAANVTATGNIFTGNNGSNTVFYHGGNNNHVNGNLIDLSTLGAPAAVWETSSGGACSNVMSGNQFEHNIIISGGGGGGYQQSGSPVNAPTITGNGYFAYAGSAVSTGGSYSDANPTTENPSLNGYGYTITPGSVIFNSPVSFPGLPSAWGPPGYSIPQTGTPPSSPH